MKDMISQFALHLQEFFIGGGKDLDPILNEDDERCDEDEAVRGHRSECLRLFKLIKSAPESGMIKALANVLASDDTDLMSWSLCCATTLAFWRRCQP